VPQPGEGVVQVAWEVVAEQFPAAVFAVEPAEVKERIVNGRLLLPLDEIVRQLSSDVFAASIGRGPVEVPGIEGFPAPFKPLGWEAPAEPAVAEPEVAPAPVSPAPPPIMAEPDRCPGRCSSAVGRAGPGRPAIETASPEPEVVQVEQRGNAELAALRSVGDGGSRRWVGDFAIVSVSEAGHNR
jgi:hypothetical protein